MYSKLSWKETKMFRVIVAGSRTFTDYELMKEKLDLVLKNIEDITIVSGTARGADTLGERYAAERGYSVLRFPADWDRYGRRAGYLRNVQMSENAEALVAFMPHGGSRGTQMMIDIANQKDMPTRVFYF